MPDQSPAHLPPEMLAVGSQLRLAGSYAWPEVGAKAARCAVREAVLARVGSADGLCRWSLWGLAPPPLQLGSD